MRQPESRRGSRGVANVGRIVLSGLVLAGASDLAPAAAAVVTRASVDGVGNEANAPSWYPWLSATGRYVSFYSWASNLVPNDTNGVVDIFVKDRRTGRTERVSVDSDGNQANGRSFDPMMDGRGRFVVFYSEASNLVPGDSNGVADIFVHDRKTGRTTRASVDSSGTEANGPSSMYPAISADGRHVVFLCAASNLVPNDTNGVTDVFVRDLKTNETTRVNVDSAANEANGESAYFAHVSANGRWVAFESAATNLVPGDGNGARDVFVRDRHTGQTTRISVDGLGVEGDADSREPVLSHGGRYVTYHSLATNLVAGDTNAASDVFVHDRKTGRTSRVSVDSFGSEANGDSYVWSVSASGRFVGFNSAASNLVAGDGNGAWDVFVHDRKTGETIRVSEDGAGNEGSLPSVPGAALSADGRTAAFASFASNLVPGDGNGGADVFVREAGTCFATPSEPDATPDRP